MASGDDFDAIEPFLRPLMDQVEPRQRKRLIEKLMRLARRANAKRMTANVQPDGSAMAPRKPRDTTKRGRKAKMFKRIGKAASLKVRATPDEGELRFVNPLVEHTAAEHHFGLEGFVGKTRKGRVIRTKYQARQLLGFGEEKDEFLDEALRHLERR
jgi:phage virion morphogenesis protein